MYYIEVIHDTKYKWLHLTTKAQVKIMPSYPLTYQIKHGRQTSLFSGRGSKYSLD